MIATKTEMEMPYMLPFGGVMPSKENGNSPLDQEHNKDYCNWKGPQFVSNDGVQNVLLNKVDNIEEKLANLAYDIDKMKSLFSTTWHNVKEAGRS